jgi:hypothetical protein
MNTAAAGSCVQKKEKTCTGLMVCCAVAATSAQDTKPRIHYWDLLLQNPSGAVGEQASRKMVSRLHKGWVSSVSTKQQPARVWCQLAPTPKLHLTCSAACWQMADHHCVCPLFLLQIVVHLAKDAPMVHNVVEGSATSFPLILLGQTSGPARVRVHLPFVMFLGALHVCIEQLESRATLWLASCCVQPVKFPLLGAATQADLRA